MLITPEYGDQQSVSDYKNGFHDGRCGNPSLHISRYYDIGFQEGVKELIKEELECQH